MKILATFLTPKAPATRAGRVILVKREHAGAFHPFVTGWQGSDDNHQTFDQEWCSGHYFENEDEARRDFQARCARGY